MFNQVQCANCYCTLYFTSENGPSGVTGEVCSSCQSKDNSELANYFDDEDD